MLYAGLDLSRKCLDFHLLDSEGATVEVGAAPPDADGLLSLTRRLDRHREPIRAAIESMNGARFVHDRLELAGWQVEIADAQKVKGLAPLACKTDRIDARVLAELARRDLVPAIWLPDPMVRAERERARWRLHLVRHRSSLKQRVHAVLLTHGKRCPVSDLFGVRGRQLLANLALPEPWQATIDASLRLIDELDREITDCERELRRLGADHRYVPLLCTVPGISWVLAYTIAAEIGDINRFPTPRKLAGYSGLCPRVYQSGERDLRGPLAKQGPRYLRWALVEAATHACTAPVYRNRDQQTKARIGKQRGAKVAQVDLARRLAEAIWHMLTRGQPFAPKGATDPSGHACFTGAFTEALQVVFGTDKLPLTVSSTAAGAGPPRTFEQLSDVRAEVANARIWAGLHFRNTMEEGAKLGQKVVHHVAPHYFREAQGNE